MDVNLQETDVINIDLGDSNGFNIDSDVKMYRGPRGYSNYDLAVQNGFSGSVEDYLESLKGEPGVTKYVDLPDKPSISGVKLIDDKSFEDLGAVSLTNTEIEKLINNIVL